MAKSRDGNFSKRTKNLIEGRAGCVCSFPDCRIPTRGASLNDDGVIKIGEAAHICAASPGGRRYDKEMTPEQRSSVSNGIWVCANHHKVIDSDDSTFTVELLREWKKKAENESWRRIQNNNRPLSQAVFTDMELATQILHASKEDLCVFRRTAKWPSTSVPLTLKVSEFDSPVDTTTLARAAISLDDLILVAGPGMGKTTTLFQIAEGLIDNGNIPLIVPLGDWATESTDILTSVLNRPAFREISENDFRQIADQPGVVLLLDGWNELDTRARRRARTQIYKLKAELPNIGLVISTRRQAFDIPFEGTQIELLPLNEEQQMQIAVTMCGEDAGASILDRAWRTMGISELVTIPLYLVTLLSLPKDAPFPTTKEGMLRHFVSAHEKNANHAEALQGVVQGFQQRYLEDMAVFAMRNSNTFITEDKARRSISDTGDLLVSEGQITNKPEPNPVLDALVSNHVLMRMGESGYSFQHQQLQEWYVSHWIESRIIGEVSDSKRCEGLAEIFNFPLWEEAILFAIERLAHGDSDRQIVCGKAILVAFDVDPILAAEMIFRSTNEVWGRIDKTIQESITRWHAPGKVDRALRFMVTSGRSEFINAVWPLITNKDEQISLNALRNCGQFKPSILGDDAGKKIKLLPPDARLVLLKEMVWCSGIDGIDIATEVAKADPVSEIKKSVIEDLIFQRANRHVAEVLEESDDEIFDMVVRENLVSELGNRQVRENLAKARERQSRAKKSDIDQLRMIVFAQDNEDYSTELTQIISTMKIKQRGEEQWGGEIGLISEAHNRYPHAVANGLLERVRAGRTLFYNAANMLASAEFNIDGNEIVQLALDNPTRHDERAESAASVLGKKSATRFLEEFLNVETRLLTSGEHDKMTGEIYRGLQSRIEYVSGPSLVAAVLTRSALADNQEIERLANILSRPRHIETGQERPYDSESTKTIQELVKDWGERLLVSNDSTRRQKLSVANLARRVPSVSLLPILKRLLDDNLQRYRTFLSVLRQQSKPNYQSQRSAYHEYQSIVQEVQRPMTCKYYPIFLAINAPETSDMMRAYLTDEHFGEFAAKVIAKQWQIANESPSEKRSFSLIGIDFSGVKEKRLDRADNPNKTSPGAEAIFAVIDSLIAKGATDEQKNLAVKLGIAASRLPHGQRDDTIQQLIALSPTRQDRERLLLHLALSGKDIDAEIVANSIAEIIEKTPNKNDELQAWMSLLPFVDYPTKILNVIRKMPPEQRDPRLFRDMIKAFGDSTSERAEDAFFNLAKEDPRFYSIYEWQTTAFQFGTSNSAHYILDLTAQGVFEGGSMADSHLIKELGNIIASSPDIRMYAYELLKKRPILHGHVKIAQAVAWNPDEDGVFLLIKFEEESRCSSLATQAVEKITTKHVPSEIPKNNAFRVVPIPANRLREKLLALTTDGSLSDTAARLLRHIDRIRDEVGIPESETRHPDLGSGKPWPILIPDPVATATNSIHLTKNL